MTNITDATNTLQPITFNTDIVLPDNAPSFTDALLVAGKNNDKSAFSDIKVNSTTSNTVSIPYFGQAEASGDWTKGVSGVAAVVGKILATSVFDRGINGSYVGATLTPISELGKIVQDPSMIGEAYLNSKAFISIRPPGSTTAGVATLDMNGISLGEGKSQVLAGGNVITFENARVEATNTGGGASANAGFMVKIPFSDKLLNLGLTGLQRLSTPIVAANPIAGGVVIGGLEVVKATNPSIYAGVATSGSAKINPTNGEVTLQGAGYKLTGTIPELYNSAVDKSGNPQLQVQTGTIDASVSATWEEADGTRGSTEIGTPETSTIGTGVQPLGNITLGNTNDMTPLFTNTNLTDVTFSGFGSTPSLDYSTLSLGTLPETLSTNLGIPETLSSGYVDSLFSTTGSTLSDFGSSIGGSSFANTNIDIADFNFLA
jgi:hypothetical protein